MPSCAISTCTSSNRNAKARGVSFFKFPTDPAVIKIWKRVCKRGDPINIHAAVICSEHFEPEMIEGTLRRDFGMSTRRFLVQGAVPTLNLPYSTVQPVEKRKKSLERKERYEQRDVKKLVCDKLAPNRTAAGEPPMSEDQPLPTLSLSCEGGAQVKMPTTERFCSAVNCFNSSKNNEELSFFPFPKDEERRKIWLENAGCSDILSKSGRRLQQYILCADHFENNCFPNIFEKHKLKKDAIPTLFVPVAVGSLLAPSKTDHSELDPSGTAESCYEIIVRSQVELKNPTQSASGKFIFGSRADASVSDPSAASESCYEIIVESETKLDDQPQSTSGKLVLESDLAKEEEEGCSETSDSGQPNFESGADFSNEECGQANGGNSPTPTLSPQLPTFQATKGASLQPLTVAESDKDPSTNGDDDNQEEHCSDSVPNTEKHFKRFYKHVLQQLQASPYKQARDLSELEILWHFGHLWNLLPSKSRAAVWKRLQLFELVSQYGWDAALLKLQGDSTGSIQVDHNILHQALTVQNGNCTHQQRPDKSIQALQQPSQVAEEENSLATADSAVRDAVVEEPTTASTSSVEYCLSELIPLRNDEAKYPAEVYDIHSIMSRDEYEALVGVAEELCSASKETIRNWKAEAKYSKFVSSWLPRLATKPSKKMQTAVLLLYYNYLVELLKLRFGALNKEDPLPHIVEPVKSSLLDKFTLRSENKNRTLVRSIPQGLKDKIISYALVIALLIENFILDLSSVQADLTVPQKRLVSISKALGCNILTQRSLTGAQTKLIQLDIPLFVSTNKDLNV